MRLLAYNNSSEGHYHSPFSNTTEVDHKVVSLHDLAYYLFGGPKGDYPCYNKVITTYIV